MYCYLIVGECIPLEVEACQALGRTTTVFPNILNQTNMQETLTVLEIFKMQSCSNNAMLYICDMLYPRCDEQSLPCSDSCWSKTLFTFMPFHPYLEVFFVSLFSALFQLSILSFLWQVFRENVAIILNQQKRNTVICFQKWTAQAHQ